MKKILLILHSFVIILMNFISKFVLGIIMPLFLKVKYKNLKEAYSIKGPFILLPNHTNQWDPFILSFAMIRPIRWLTSDAAFREAFNVLLYMCGAIPKIKGQSDIAALQTLKQGIELGHIGGIFPEGKQCWDGKTGELIPATAKLVRFLKIPVVVSVIKGGYLCKPRWAWSTRRCRIEVHFKQIINAQEIKTMKLSEIEKRLQEALVYDEYEWQKEAKAPIKSSKRAEHLELAHWACPCCSEIGEMKSEGNSLFCNCGYTVHIDQYGFFNYPEAGPSFNHPSEWIKWQENLIRESIKDKLEAADNGGEKDPVLLSDKEVVLMSGKRAQPMVHRKKGEARLYRNRIEIGSSKEGIITLPIKEVTARNTFKQQIFEFRFEKEQHRFKFPGRNISGCKWETVCNVLIEELKQRQEW